MRTLRAACGKSLELIGVKQISLYFLPFAYANVTSGWIKFPYDGETTHKIFFSCSFLLPLFQWQSVGFSNAGSDLFKTSRVESGNKSVLLQWTSSTNVNSQASELMYSAKKKVYWTKEKQRLSILHAFWYFPFKYPFWHHMSSFRWEFLYTEVADHTFLKKKKPFLNLKVCNVTESSSLLIF